VRVWPRWTAFCRSGSAQLSWWPQWDGCFSTKIKHLTRLI